MLPRSHAIALRGSIILRHCSQRPPLARTFCNVLVHHKTNRSLFQQCTRLLSTAGERKLDDPSSQHPPSSSSPSDSSIYHGPLAKTFKKLKLFSLASLSLSITLAPFMFLVEANLPASARIALASIAIGTSGLSTALVGWCGKPYVKTLKRLKTSDGAEGLELITYTLFMMPRISRVYDPYFLIETKRPFAKWELARELPLPPDRSIESITPGKEETVAETLDMDGNILGRWLVQWDENGRGRCHQAGTVVRFFNVHEELLQ